MNIKLNIKLPIKNSQNYIEATANILLSPFYITERELLNTYLVTYPKEYLEIAREIIFNNSIRADEIIGNSLNSLDTKELLIFKKNLTLCLSIVSFGNRFNTDYIKSLSRSKTLAEFSVSTTKTNDPMFVINIINDAKDCIEEISSLVNSGGLITSFVKGEANLNSKIVNRLWYHSELSPQSDKTYASIKRRNNGRYYKDGKY